MISSTERTMPESSVPTAAEAEPAPRSLFWLLSRSLLSLSAGLGVVALAAWMFDIKADQALRDVRSAPPGAVLFAVGSSFVVLALQSLRWHRVMGPLLGLPYGDAFRAQIVGFLFNALIPARGGDLLRVQYLGRRTGKSRATILGTEIVDRWLDWWGWIPTFLVMAVVSHPPKQLYQALGIFGGALTAWAIAMVVLVRTGWQPREETKPGKAFVALRQGIEAFRHPRIWTTALLIAPLPWIWEAFALTVVGGQMGCELTLVQAFSVMIAFNLSTIFPSAGGIGTVEAGGTAALLFFGFERNHALAFMFVYHFSQLLPGMAGGAVVLVAQGERLFGQRREQPGRL